MEPSEAKRKRFSRLSEEEIQNLVEGNDSENTIKATKNAVVTFVAYWNKVKPEDERVKNTESLEKIPKKELNELLANFWPNTEKQNGDSYKKSALMGIRFGKKFVYQVVDELDKNHRANDQPDDSPGDGRMYERSESPYCPVKTFELFLSKLNPALSCLSDGKF